LLLLAAQLNRVLERHNAVIESLRRTQGDRHLVRAVTRTGVEVAFAALLILGLLPAVARAAG
jgi:hypothetical protein